MEERTIQSQPELAEGAALGRMNESGLQPLVISHSAVGAIIRGVR
jgi:hypothetical protein